MAEIPVKKKSSLAWLWILLVALIIALLAWWLFAEADEEIDEREEIETTELIIDETVSPIASSTISSELVKTA